MKRFVILFSFLLLASAHAATTTNTYDVEVLVFENRIPELEGGELWRQDSSRAPIPDLAEAITAPEIPVTDPALTAAVTTLEREGQGRYRVLVHQRWRQTAEEKSATKPIRLRSTDGQLQGVFRFYMSRFLHVELDLGLQDKGDTAEGMNYRLTEQRRVKTQELQYFDHPKLGVLVRITQSGKE